MPVLCWGLARSPPTAHAPPLQVSTILDKVASVAARDEAVNRRWPDPYFFSLARALGSPGGLTESAVTQIDPRSAAGTRPTSTLRRDRRRRGAEKIVLVASCPATVKPGLLRPVLRAYFRGRDRPCRRPPRATGRHTATKAGASGRGLLFVRPANATVARCRVERVVCGLSAQLVVGERVGNN